MGLNGKSEIREGPLPDYALLPKARARCSASPETAQISNSG